MGNVIQLHTIRREQHRKWWNSHKHLIDEIIRENFEGQWGMDFSQLLDACRPDNSIFLPSWDYLDMRDIIFEAIHNNAAIDEIMDTLKTQRWYESRWISRDRIVERCLSLYVLGSSTAASNSSP